MQTKKTSDAKKELIKVVNAMLSEKIDLIEGVRKICSLRFDIGDPENVIFYVIRGIDSETDTFPLGDVRSNWDFDALARIDKEIDNYLSENKKDILESCREILKTYS